MCSEMTVDKGLQSVCPKPPQIDRPGFATRQGEANAQRRIWAKKPLYKETGLMLG